jgi:LuxR family transcriptional regulator, maltose regulon positive regulatory protein
MATTTAPDSPAGPRLVAGLVAGPRLVEVLDRGVQGPVTVIAAPAGGGKPTLVSSWLRGAELPGPPAWVSVERDESDATRFWGTVIEWLRPVQVTYSGLWQTASALLPSGSST